MRPLVTPPPSSRCGLCNGELQLKQVNQAERAPGFQNQTFVCTTCGLELACLSGVDRYSGGARRHVRPFSRA